MSNSHPDAKKPTLYGKPRRIESDNFLWSSHEAFKVAAATGNSNIIAIYAALCFIESNRGPSHKSAFYVSASDIANYAGMSPRTVERFLPELVKKRLISMVSGKRPEAGKAFQANLYRLLDFKGKSRSSDNSVDDPSANVTDRSANSVDRDGRQERYFPSPKEKKERVSSASSAEGAASRPTAGAEESGRKKKPAARYELKPETRPGLVNCIWNLK